MTDATTTSADADLDKLEEFVYKAQEQLQRTYRSGYGNHLIRHGNLLALIAELRLLRAIHEEMPKWVMEQEEPLIEKCATCGTRYGDAHADNCELAAYLAWQGQQAKAKEGV